MDPNSAFAPPPIIRLENQSSEPLPPGAPVISATQLRWQLLRSVESLQAAEAENVDLRTELAKLRVEIDKPKPAPVEEEKVDYSKISSSILKKLEPLKAELKNIRETLYNDSVSYNNDLFPKMNTVIKKLTLQNSSLLHENKMLLAENFELKSKSSAEDSELHQLSIDLKATKIENAKLKKEMEKVKASLQEYEGTKTSSAQELGSLKRKVEDLTTVLTDMKPKYDFAQAEVVRLNQQVASYEMDSQSAYDSHLSQQQNIISYYERLVNELKGENADLNLIILSMQEQIEKLTNSLLGNKSHFQKFVELKSENIQLQTKLQQITKKVNNGAILGTGSLMGSNNSLYSSSQTSTSSLSMLHNQVPKGSVNSQQGAILKPLSIPIDALSQMQQRSSTKNGVAPLSDSLDDIEKDLGETIKNRILKRRQNQNQNTDNNRQFQPEVGEVAMNSYADTEYDGVGQSNFFNHSQASGFDLSGGDMINLNLIDDSNSVCEQLSKVEAFARMQPRKLIPKHDLRVAPFNNNVVGGIANSNSNFNGGESQSALSLSARSLINHISPRGFALPRAEKVEQKGSLNLNGGIVSSSMSKYGIAANNNNFGNNFNNLNGAGASNSLGAGNSDHVRKITI